MAKVCVRVYVRVGDCLLRAGRTLDFGRFDRRGVTSACIPDRGDLRKVCCAGRADWNSVLVRRRVRLLLGRSLGLLGSWLFLIGRLGLLLLAGLCGGL